MKNSAVICIGAFCVLLSGVPALAQEVSPAVHHDVSPPLRAMSRPPLAAGTRNAFVRLPPRLQPARSGCADLGRPLVATANGLNSRASGWRLRFPFPTPRHRTPTARWADAVRAVGERVIRRVRQDHRARCYMVRWPATACGALRRRVQTNNTAIRLFSMTRPPTAGSSPSFP
jgi:hypothetical protein